MQASSAGTSAADDVTVHWRLGSQLKALGAKKYEGKMRLQGYDAFKNFDSKLRQFLTLHHSESLNEYQQHIKVRTGIPYLYHTPMIPTDRFIHFAVSTLNTRVWRTGPSEQISYAATQSSMDDDALTMF
jgi:hypothetical protein